MSAVNSLTTALADAGLDKGPGADGSVSIQKILLMPKWLALVDVSAWLRWVEGNVRSSHIYIYIFEIQSTTEIRSRQRQTLLIFVKSFYCYSNVL